MPPVGLNLDRERETLRKASIDLDVEDGRNSVREKRKGLSAVNEGDLARGPFGAGDIVQIQARQELVMATILGDGIE